MVIMSASQADHGGSIPLACSKRLEKLLFRLTAVKCLDKRIQATFFNF